MIRIAILAFEHCIYSSVLGPLDVFSVAEQEMLNEGKGTSFCSVEILTVEGHAVKSFNGLTIQPHHPIDLKQQFDIVFIPALFGATDGKMMEDLFQSFKLLEWLLKQHEQGACLSSVCAGSFLLAESGLLDGLSATTHWKLASLFEKRYPKVNLKPKKMLVDEGSLVTAGGVTAYFDLSLHLISRFASPELAATCSKILLIDPGRRSQTPYQMSNTQTSHDDAEIKVVQDWLDGHFAEPIQNKMLSEMAKMGERTFLRRFKKATGDSPGEYLQTLRLEAARKMLEVSTKTVEEITWEVGYEDSNSFRRLFKKQLGLSPGAYRKKFSLLGL